jgi:hypothetical protein
VSPAAFSTRARWAVCLLFGGLLAVLAFGAWSGFPVFDDAYMVLFLREASVKALEAQHPHRPLFGLLLKWATGAFGIQRLPYVALSTAFWALLAWQTARLSRRLAPGAPEIAASAALLTLAPILVSTQFTTATTVLPANLPVSLCLAAVLLGLGDDAQRLRGRIAGAAVLVAASVVVSEYGIAAGAAGVALLAVCRRYRAAIALAVGAACGYVLFRAQADLSVRVKQSPSAQLGALLGHPHVAAVRFGEGLWDCLVGAWAGAAGAVRFSFSDRSTLLAAAAGGAAAATVVLLARRRDVESAGPFGGRGPWGLLAAIAAGILPVVLANRSLSSGDPYESRYLLPVLPFAALAVALGLSRVTAPRYRRAALAMVAFVGAYRVVVGAFEARQEQGRMEEIGALLRPLVQDSSGITVAVVPDRWKLDGSDMTPKVTWKWDDAAARRVWVMPASRAAVEFGPRVACHGTAAIDLPPELMATPRSGALSHLVWLTAWGRSAGVLEPYCVLQAP